MVVPAALRRFFAPKGTPLRAEQAVVVTALAINRGLHRELGRVGDEIVLARSRPADPVAAGYNRKDLLVDSKGLRVRTEIDQLSFGEGLDQNTYLVTGVTVRHARLSGRAIPGLQDNVTADTFGELPTDRTQNIVAGWFRTRATSKPSGLMKKQNVVQAVIRGASIDFGTLEFALARASDGQKRYRTHQYLLENGGFLRRDTEFTGGRVTKESTGVPADAELRENLGERHIDVRIEDWLGRNA